MRRAGVGFFFSSRRRHTRLVSDWSSDVCSSDLTTMARRSSPYPNTSAVMIGEPSSSNPLIAAPKSSSTSISGRSEERRVGKECRFGGARESEGKKEGQEYGERVAYMSEREQGAR